MKRENFDPLKIPGVPRLCGITSHDDATPLSLGDGVDASDVKDERFLVETALRSKAILSGVISVT